MKTLLAILLVVTSFNVMAQDDATNAKFYAGVEIYKDYILKRGKPIEGTTNRDVGDVVTNLSNRYLTCAAVWATVNHTDVTSIPKTPANEAKGTMTQLHLAYLATSLVQLGVIKDAKFLVGENLTNAVRSGKEQMKDSAVASGAVDQCNTLYVDMISPLENLASRKAKQVYEQLQQEKQ